MATHAFPPTSTETEFAETRNASLLDRIVEHQADVASRYQPVMDIDDSIKRYEALKRYIEKVLIEGVDYGTVPGVDKPFLFKSGAQKLCMLFGYVPHYESRVQIEDWVGTKFGEPLFYYQYACVLTKDSKPVGEGIGSANSWESKYRYRWVSEDDAKRIEGWEKFPRRVGSIKEFAFAVDKAETSGPYGKPAEYWQRFKDAIESGQARKAKRKTKSGEEMDAWEIGGSMVRVPNDQFPDVINTCQKQGEKRSYVEATLSATGASQFFTQDEDGAMDVSGIDTGGHKVGTQAAADHVANRKVEEMKQQRQAPPAEKKAAPAGKSTDFAMLGEFSKMKKGLALVSSGDVEYYRILGMNGFEHANEITDKALAKRIYMQMEARRRELAAAGQQTSDPVSTQAQPAAQMAEAEGTGYVATAEDLPSDVWPEGRD